MNCASFENRLDEYLDGDLADDAYGEMASHLQACADCQRRLAQVQALRVALRTLPASAPRPGFFDEAIARAQGPRASYRNRWAYVTGAALAASLALWIGAGMLPSLSPPAAKPIGVTIALHQTRTVQLAFNADRELNQATLRITLPDGIELQGFPGQREVSWQTNIARGANMLALPLTAVSATGGNLLARLEHGDRSTELAVVLHVSNATPTGSLAPGLANNEYQGVRKEKDHA